MTRPMTLPGMLLLSISLLISSVAFANDKEVALAKGDVLVHVADVPQVTGSPVQKGTFFSGWLHMLDNGSSETATSTSTLAYVSQVPGDIVRVLAASGGENSGVGFLILLVLSLLSIAVGYLVSVPLRKKMKSWGDTILLADNSQEMSGSRFQKGLIRSFPDGASLVFASVVAGLFFITISGVITSGNRMVFMFVLGSFLVVRTTKIIARLLIAPDNPEYRVLAVGENLIQPVYGLIWQIPAMILGSMLTLIFFREIGVKAQTLSWLFIIAGTVVLFLIGLQLFTMRLPVTDALCANHQSAGENAYKDRLASYWHIPALTYLLICWLFWVGQELAGTAPRNGVLIASIMVVPMFLFLSHAGKLIIHSVIQAMNLFTVHEPEVWEQTISAENDETDLTPAEKTAALTDKVHRVFRILLFIMLTTWLLSLWGHNIPFAANALKAIFESLVILVLALFCWQYASAYIARKIEEATPEDKGEKENSDDEFGGAAPRGRSHTLLPMLRKVLATVLVVLVTLVVISSFGVNIGPLLAGAGVLGLAIGFGAQKLVSDVLSGFFFLMDDAFRVGEYIQAGSVKGTVEGITLRNVLLRHHLGMLQVVPHSELGSITNFMRGGIVVRFPLEFPYDTEIDKVRKIIKKVGQAMLADPELGDDFILPVKSQGVNEITNSVMVIRVKFTAKPGKQFVIRREAYRRITEALNAKGIYYAHRKVIVDFPEGKQLPEMSDEQRRVALEGGAAAAVLQESEKVPKLE